VAVIYAQLGLVGDAVRTGNKLLPLYQELAATPGPGGKHYLKAEAFLPTSPCALILGLSWPGTGTAGGR
jgi:phospholipid/cholesterol/gamma-HCH transport system substrate-binding protein